MGSWSEIDGTEMPSVLSPGHFPSPPQLAPQTAPDYDPLDDWRYLGSSGNLQGPGPPCCGKAILSFAPSRTKTTTQRLENTFRSVLCCECLPLWSRGIMFLIFGVIFLTLGTLGTTSAKLVAQERVRSYYMLSSSSNDGFTNWSFSSSSCDPAAGGRVLKVFMFDCQSCDREMPQVIEQGPYVYKIGWNYSGFNWTQDRNNLTFVAEENITFCPSWGQIGMHSDADPVTNFDGSGALLTLPVRDWVYGPRPVPGNLQRPSWPGLQNSLYMPPGAVDASPRSRKVYNGGILTTTTRNITIYTGSENISTMDYLTKVVNRSCALTCAGDVKIPKAENGEEQCPCAWQSAGQSGEELAGHVGGSVGSRFPFGATALSAFAIRNSNATFTGYCQHADGSGPRYLQLWVPALLRFVSLNCSDSSPLTIGNLKAHAYHVSPKDGSPSEDNWRVSQYGMHADEPWIFPMKLASRGPGSSYIVMSFPHFYKANASLKHNAATLLRNSSTVQWGGNEPYHAFQLQVEGSTGQRVGGAARLQTNVYVSTNRWKGYVPVAWTSDEQNATAAELAAIQAFVPQLIVKIVQEMISLVLSSLCIFLGIKDYVQWRRLEKAAVRRVHRSSARFERGVVATRVRRFCMTRLGLCGIDLPNLRQQIKAERFRRQSELVIGPGSLQSVGQPQRKYSILSSELSAQFGPLEDVSEDSAEEETNPSTVGVNRVTLAVWHDLVAPPQRSTLSRLSSLLELLPWFVWWGVGILPYYVPVTSHVVKHNGDDKLKPPMGPDAHLLNFRSATWHLLVPTVLSWAIVLAQIVTRRRVPRLDRVYVLVPTAIDITTLAIFSCCSVLSYVTAEVGLLHVFWPAITHGILLLVASLCIVCGHYFTETALCREVRPELWGSESVQRATRVTSRAWIGILLVVEILVFMGPLLPVTLDERYWVAGVTPAFILMGAMLFNIWFPVQLETDLVRDLNRLLRRGYIEPGVWGVSQIPRSSSEGDSDDYTPPVLDPAVTPTTTPTTSPEQSEQRGHSATQPSVLRPFASPPGDAIGLDQSVEVAPSFEEDLAAKSQRLKSAVEAAFAKNEDVSRHLVTATSFDDNLTPVSHLRSRNPIKNRADQQQRQMRFVRGKTQTTPDATVQAGWVSEQEPEPQPQLAAEAKALGSIASDEKLLGVRMPPTRDPGDTGEVATRDRQPTEQPEPEPEAGPEPAVIDGQDGYEEPKSRPQPQALLKPQRPASRANSPNQFATPPEDHMASVFGAIEGDARSENSDDEFHSENGDHEFHSEAGDEEFHEAQEVFLY